MTFSDNQSNFVQIMLMIPKKMGVVFWQKSYEWKLQSQMVSFDDNNPIVVLHRSYNNDTLHSQCVLYYKAYIIRGNTVHKKSFKQYFLFNIERINLKSYIFTDTTGGK